MDVRTCTKPKIGGQHEDNESYSRHICYQRENESSAR